MRVFRISPANSDWTETMGWWCPGVTVLAESVEQALEMVEKDRGWIGWQKAGDLTVKETVGPAIIQDPDVDV